MTAKKKAKPATTEAEIWRQIGPRADSEIQRARRLRIEKDKMELDQVPLFDPDLVEPSMPTPTLRHLVDWLLGAAKGFCENLNAICDSTRREENLEETPAFKRAIFWKVIFPQIDIERQMGTERIQATGWPGGPVSVIPDDDVTHFERELIALELDWLVKQGVALPTQGPAANSAKAEPEERKAQPPEETSTDSQVQPGVVPEGAKENRSGEVPPDLRGDPDNVKRRSIILQKPEDVRRRPVQAV